MPKDTRMHDATLIQPPPVRGPVTPWSLRSWPPLFWQADRPMGLQLRHLGTRITSEGDGQLGPAGQTLWAGSSADGAAGVAWDWVLLTQGIVAMADPMCVITNLRLVGQAGEVLTAPQAALFLGQIVHSLPWQCEVQRALRDAH